MANFNFKNWALVGALAAGSFFAYQWYNSPDDVSGNNDSDTDIEEIIKRAVSEALESQKTAQEEIFIPVDREEEIKTREESPAPVATQPPEPAPAPAPQPAFTLSSCAELAQQHDSKTLTDTNRLNKESGAYFDKSKMLFLTTEDGKNSCVFNMRDKKFPIPVAAFDMAVQGNDYYAAMQKALAPKVMINGSNATPYYNIAACAALGRSNEISERLNENRGRSRDDFLRRHDGQIFNKEHVFFVVMPEAPQKTACAFAYDNKNQHVPLAWFDMTSPEGIKSYYAERDRMSNPATQRKNPDAGKDTGDAVIKALRRNFGLGM